MMVRLYAREGCIVESLEIPAVSILHVTLEDRRFVGIAAVCTRCCHPRDSESGIGCSWN
jgi:hypothetical protein